MRWPWSKTVTKALAAGNGGFDGGPVPPPTKPAGSDGVTVYGGFVVSGERDTRLAGTQKWVTYNNIELNVAIAAAAINVWTTLGGSAKWHAEPNRHGGNDAQRAADLVTDGLLEAQLSQPWCAVVRKQLLKKFRGFALHEVLIRRRSDGVVVVGDLLDRPQWTISRWNKPDEQHAWLGVEQLTRTGGTAYIPRERLLYSVENTLSGAPDGVGLLRQMVEPVRVLELYRQWEGIGFQTDLRGMPSARAPLAKLREDAQAVGAKTEADIQAYTKAQTQWLVDFLIGHAKKPEQGVLLDSAPYTSKDAGQTPSAMPQWAFELVRGAVSGMPEVGVAIGRETRDIARIMCAEFLMLGAEDSGGAYSMHADKTAMFGLCVNSALGDVAADATRDIAARLVSLNGLDPETCTPRLVPEPVATAAVDAACRSLMMLFQAGLNPKDPAINVLRGRMDLPPAPEIDETEWTLARGETIERVSGGKPEGIVEGAPTAADPGIVGNVNARPEPKGPQ